MGKYQNLHSHTTTSDGKLTYHETLAVCYKNLINVVAFTDHDSLPSEINVNKLRKLNSHPVKWIIGIEISSGLPKELGGQPTSNFHIVGLFVNPFDNQLKKYCQKMQQARITRMQTIVKNLKQLGFQINQEDCLKEAHGETVNRPHIVAALAKKQNNFLIIEKLKQKMELESKHNYHLKKKYLDMVKNGPGQYPYSLFLSDHAYISGIYVNYLYGLDLDQTVEIIRNSGGVAILAHWTFCKNKVSLKMVQKLVKTKRIDGLETIYNPNIHGRRNEILTDMNILKKLTIKYKVLQSGGADAHDQEEIVTFFKNQLLARKTIGLAQQIIKQKKLINSWTSLNI